jgi:hypothetical protein
MISQRSTHYWLWFLLFGVVSSIVAVMRQHALDTESVWLLVTGMLGILLGGLGGRLARPYDLVVGVFFTGIGILGILHNLGVHLVAQNGTSAHAIDTTSVLGLSLSLVYALIHLWLGLTSLNSGLATRRLAPTVAVASAPAE